MVESKSFSLDECEDIIHVNSIRVHVSSTFVYTSPSVHTIVLLKLNKWVLDILSKSPLRLTRCQTTNLMLTYDVVFVCASSELLLCSSTAFVGLPKDDHGYIYYFKRIFANVQKMSLFFRRSYLTHLTSWKNELEL